MNQRPTNQELSGMTMNERLFACGLMDEFDAAIRNGEREAFITIVTQLAFTKKDAEAYADAQFENLRKRKKS
ncbi:MAG: hypothetical protein HZA31_11435 [Opitutae bacterium]|nr:hypothetical protein [Opitutae bacterium]